MPNTAEVVICGAGMAGVATAYNLVTTMGMNDVVLIDKLGPLSFTTAKTGETYNYSVWAWDPPVLHLMQRSLELMKDLARDTGNIFNMNRRGRLYVATTAEIVTDFRHSLQEFARLGLGPVRVYEPGVAPPAPYVPPPCDGFEGAILGLDLLLDQGLIRAHYPYLCEDAKAILQVRTAGWFNGHTLGACLLERAKEQGARVLQGEVVAVDKDSRGVCAVEVMLESGRERIHTRRFVNAAGPFVKRVTVMVDPGLEIPVKNHLSERIFIRDYLGIVPRSAPSFNHGGDLFLEWSESEIEEWRTDDEYRWLLKKFSTGPSIRPEGGGDSDWIIIAWGYNEEACRPYYVSEPTWEPQMTNTEEFVDLTLRAASVLIPGLKQYIGRMPKPVHDGGYLFERKDPVTGEFVALPLVGPLGVDGAFVVNVFPGVCCGCAGGELCAAWVAGDDLPGYADEFSIERYQ